MKRIVITLVALLLVPACCAPTRAALHHNAPNAFGDPSKHWGPKGPPLWDDTCFWAVWETQSCQGYT